MSVLASDQTPWGVLLNRSRRCRLSESSIEDGVSVSYPAGPSPRTSTTDEVDIMSPYHSEMTTEEEEEEDRRGLKNEVVDGTSTDSGIAVGGQYSPPERRNPKDFIGSTSDSGASEDGGSDEDFPESDSPVSEGDNEDSESLDGRITHDSRTELASNIEISMEPAIATEINVIQNPERTKPLKSILKKTVSWNENVYVNNGPDMEVSRESLQERDHEYNPLNMDDEDVFHPDLTPDSPVEEDPESEISSFKTTPPAPDKEELMQPYVHEDHGGYAKKCCICVLALLLTFTLLALAGLAVVYVWKNLPSAWSDEVNNVKVQMKMNLTKTFNNSPFSEGWASKAPFNGHYYLIENKGMINYKKPSTDSILTWHRGEPIQVTGWNPDDPVSSQYVDYVLGDPLVVQDAQLSVVLMSNRFYRVKIALQKKYCLLSIVPLNGKSLKWYNIGGSLWKS